MIVISLDVMLREESQVPVGKTFLAYSNDKDLSFNEKKSKL